MARNFLKAEVKSQFQNWTASYGPIVLKAQGPSKKKGNGETGLPTMDQTCLKAEVDRAIRNLERHSWVNSVSGRLAGSQRVQGQLVGLVSIFPKSFHIP